MEINNFTQIDDVKISLLLQKIDRILASNEKISVSQDIYSDVAACSDLAKLAIYINFTKLKNNQAFNIFDIENYLMLLKGLNYHELSHVLYSNYGRKTVEDFLNLEYNSQLTLPSDKRRYIDTSTFFELLNVLEDGRIENLFSLKYKRAEKYFIFCINKIILNSIKSIDSSNTKSYFGKVFMNYLLIYCRKFLSPQIKLAIKNSLITANNCLLFEKCEILCDKFLVEPDLQNRFKIAIELAYLLKDNNLLNNIKSSSNPRSLMENNKNRKGLDKRNKEQSEKLSDKIDVDNKESEENEEDGEESEETGKSQNTTNKNDKLLKKIKKLVEKESDKVMNDINIKTENENDLAAIKNVEGDDFSGETFSASGEDYVESSKLTNTLKKLRNTLSNRVLTQQARGKIDIKSAMLSKKNNPLRIYKKQFLNQINKSKIGVSILLDSSGSVENSQFRTEIKSAWSLSKALENIQNKVEIIEFSSNCKKIKSFNNTNSQGSWARHFRNSTDVEYALELAQRNLIELKKKENINNLFIIIITDGAFSSYERAMLRIKAAQKAGIKIIWILAQEYRSASKNLVAAVNWFIWIKSLNELNINLNKIIGEIQKKIIEQITQDGGYFNYSN